MTTTDYIAKSYRTLRAQGIPAFTAHGIASEAQRIRTFESEHVTYLSSGVAQVTLSDGWVYTVDADYDGDVRPTDYDAYDAADIEAWENDEWYYAVIKVTATSPTGKVSETDYLGGVEVGPYWGRTSLLDSEQQALSAALGNGMFANARYLAEAVPTCHECGHELP